jgi:hypothetical protein
MESVTIDKTLSLTIEKTAKPRPPPSLSLTPPPSLSPIPPPSLTNAFANTASFVFETCTSEGRGFIGRVALDLVSREVTALVRRRSQLKFATGLIRREVLSLVSREVAGGGMRRE